MLVANKTPPRACLGAAVFSAVIIALYLRQAGPGAVGQA